MDQKKRIEVSSLQTTLKGILSKKKIRTHDIASALNISLATAKRLLNSNDLSLNRVIQLCELADISFDQLIEINQSMQLQTYKNYSQCQEEFLSKHPLHFLILSDLRANSELGTIAKNLQISINSLDSYLIDLEEEGFIKKTNRGYEAIIEHGADWIRGGPLWTKFLPPLLTKFCEHFITNGYQDKNSFFDFASRKLSKNTLKQYKIELDQLSRKYAHLAKLESQTLDKKDLVPMNCLFIFQENWDLKQIYKDIFKS